MFENRNEERVFGVGLISNLKSGGNISVDLEYITLPLKALQVKLPEGRKTSDYRNRTQLSKSLRLVLPDGREFEMSDRFWLSFSVLFSLNRSVFDYWDYMEVFSRVSISRDDRPVRLTLEKLPVPHDNCYGTALALSVMTRPVFNPTSANRLISEHDGKMVSYSKGVMSATFDCPFAANLIINGDDHRIMFTIEAPLDGFGAPAAYLCVLRQICSNGLVGRTKAFKQTFQLASGDDGFDSVLNRAMETFNNEEGFHVIKQRLEDAGRSWASMYEYLQLSRVLRTVSDMDRWGLAKTTQIMGRLDSIAKAPLQTYTIAAVNELPQRFLRTLAIECSVYDLINFATETATHHTTALGAKNRLYSWVGELITSDMYDLHNTMTTYPHFADMFLRPRDEREDKSS